MPPPAQMPLGLQLSRTARVVGNGFDAALAEEGGSLPVWLVLLNLRIGPPGTQRDLAARVGIREATLTHHLTALERDGLVARERDPDNRRVQLVTLTPAGEQLFLRLRGAAAAFDRRLAKGLSADDRRHASRLLDQLAANVGAEPAPTPWTHRPSSRTS